MTKEEIRGIRRKMLRYLFFTFRDNVEVFEEDGTPRNHTGYDDEIREFFEALPNFIGWDKFEIVWDIGLKEDPIAAALRENKWFLVEAHSDEIVIRPQDFWEEESRRTGIPAHLLKEMDAGQRGMSLTKYNALFKGVY